MPVSCCKAGADSTGSHPVSNRNPASASCMAFKYALRSRYSSGSSPCRIRTTSLLRPCPSCSSRRTRALKSFVVKTIDPDVRHLLETLQTQGMTFGVCGNTMKNFSITLQELPDGSRPIPQGGVVRIMELQDAGYRYMRP